MDLHQPGDFWYLNLWRRCMLRHAAYGNTRVSLWPVAAVGHFLPGRVERLRRCLASTREWSPPEAPSTALWSRRYIRYIRYGQIRVCFYSCYVYIFMYGVYHVCIYICIILYIIYISCVYIYICIILYIIYICIFSICSTNRHRDIQMMFTIHSLFINDIPNV